MRKTTDERIRPSTDPRYLSSKEAAHRLQVSPPYFRQLVEAGEIPSISMPNFGKKGLRQRLRFDLKDLENFMERLKKTAVRADEVARDVLVR